MVTYQFDVASDHPLRAEHAKLDEYLRSDYDPDLQDVPAMQEILASSRDEQARYLQAAIERLRSAIPMFRKTEGYGYTRYSMAGGLGNDIDGLAWLVDRMALRQQEWRPKDLAYCVARMSAPQERNRVFGFGPITGAVEKSGLPVEGTLAKAITSRATQLAVPPSGEAMTKRRRLAVRRLRRLLGEDTLSVGEDMRERVAAAAPASDWDALARHALTAKGSKPSKRWLKNAATHVNAVGGFDAFAATVTPWFLDFPTHQLESGKDGTSDLYKGLVWYAILDETGAFAEPLGALADRVLTKVANYGAIDILVGNACLYAFGVMPGMDGIAHLSRLKRRAKWPSMQEKIEASLLKAGERLGLSIDDLEEIGVPTLGLGPGGELREEFGPHTARLRIAGTKTVALTWLKDGKERKSVPVEVKRDHADGLKQLRATAKQLRALLPVQRDRLDGLFAVEREWPLPTWRERYLDHPIVGALTRRLIWRFDGRAALPLGDALVGSDDEPVTGETVSLWHPLEAPPDEVAAWRDALERHGITQPFKQAHREIYVLTDAERRTRTYSNRFATHILRQHQMRALCEQRGWRYTLVGDFDSACFPDKDLAGGYTAEFHTDAPPDFPTAASGIYLCVVADRVRFRKGRLVVPLADVPPRLFTETMRDVDLFVGVASVGADPTWRERPAQREYWDNYAFGELSATAQTRRDVLEKLVPQLAIADRCTLGDRFLAVRGNRGAYKIHLGSSNILMEPNDAYLCIVGARGKATKVFLPFEGDETLALILSKAFLLAADEKITDPEILSQLPPD